MLRRTVLLLGLTFWPICASGQQIIESAGTRALGMGGAFTAVADDATAAYWNPAGLASGPPGGITIGWLDFRSGDQTGLPAEGPSSRSAKFVSLGTWPLGLSYGTFHENSFFTDQAGSVQAQSFVVSEFGATVLQTLAPGITVGSTLKYMRGKVIRALPTGFSAGAALDNIAKAEGASSGEVDFDLGAMADFGKARLGLMVRNLRQPSFGNPVENPITLHRRARVGVAVLPATGLTLAIDLDLDTVDLRDGPRRIVAVGGEDRVGRRWAFRSGVRWSVEGARRLTASIGASLALRRNAWVDWQYTRGKLDADRGFGVALRAGF